MQNLVIQIADEIKANHQISQDISRYIKRAIDYILIYCNRDDIPKLAESILYQMVESSLKKEGILSNDTVKSITVGDTSITYADIKQEWEELGFNDRLNHFKKMKLPSGR